MRPLRWLFTVAGLVLIAVFAIFLIPRSRPQRHLVAIAIWASDPLTVEPQPFVREDLNALSQIPNVHFVESGGVQDSRSFASLGSQLRDVVRPGDDLLTLYLAAHGLIQDEKAHIACSDFLRDSQSGTFPVSRLLEQLAECPVKVKLLILDAGRLDFEPALGIAANGFPRLLAEELAEMPKQELWVLLSNAPLRRTAMAYPWRQSLFGHGVADALHGAADMQPVDQYVTLYELYTHVRDQCAGWFAASPLSRQTPLLMKAGLGVVEPTREQQGDELHQLVWLGGKSKEKDRQSEEEGDQQDAQSADGRPDGKGDDSPAAGKAAPSENTGAQDPAVAPGKEPQASDGEPDQKASEKPAAEPADPPVSKSPPATTPAATPREDSPGGKADREDSERLLAVLAEAWSLRDELQESAAAIEWSPIHFAPHLWRELNARLLALEQHARAGQSFEPLQGTAVVADYSMASLLDEAVMFRDDLRTLKQRWRNPANAPVTLNKKVAQNLNQLWEQSRTLPNRKTPNAAAMLPAVAEVRQIAYRVNQMVFAASDYVRYYAIASFTPDVTLPKFEDLRDYLDKLGKLRQKLDGMQLSAVQDTDAFTGIPREFNELVEMRNRLDQTVRNGTDSDMKTIEDLKADLRNGTDSTRRMLRLPLALAQIENELLMLRLPADRRRELVSGLLAAPEPAVGRRGADQPAKPGTSIERRSAQRVLERVELELLLLQMVDLARAKELNEPLESIRNRVEASTWDEQEFWSECRKVGTALRDYYEELPQREGYGVLLLVHPRDADRVPRNSPRYEFNPVVNTRPRLVLGGTRQLRLSVESPRELTVELRANREDLLKQVPALEVDDRLVQLTGRLQEGSVQPDAGWFTKTLTWQLTARMNLQQAGASETDGSVTVRWNDDQGLQEAEHRFSLLLPAPNVIDLTIRQGETFVKEAAASNQLTLGLFPNRITPCQFLLVNRSGVDRQVEIALYAIGPHDPVRLAPGVIDDAIRNDVWSAETGVRNAVLVARTSAPVSLPGTGEQPVPVTLAHPAAAVPEPSPKPEAGEPAPAPKPPPAFSPVDINHGLLCVIRDVQDTETVWHKWIEWRVIEPHEFLGTKVGYDYARRGIYARVYGKDVNRDDRPDLPPGKPVQIAWIDARGDIPAGTTKKSVGEIDANQPSVELFANVPADDAERLVSLTIDGYPRGLVFQVPCDRERPVVGNFRDGGDLRRTEARVQINWIEAPGFPFEFHFPPFVDFSREQPPPAGEGAPAASQRLQVRSREDYVYLPAPCRELQVHFEVDAPADAFGNSEDRIEIRIGDDPTPAMVCFADRSATARLVAPGANGMLEFDTQVGDYSVKIDPGPVENEQTSLKIDMHLPRVIPDDVRDYVKVGFDSAPPVLEESLPLHGVGKVPAALNGNVFQVPLGQPLHLRVKAVDLSGIEVAEYAFVDRGARRDTLQNPKSSYPSSSRGGSVHVFEIPLDTKDLPLNCDGLLLRLRDRTGHDSPVHPIGLQFVANKPMVAKGVIAGLIVSKRNNQPVKNTRFDVAVSDAEGKFAVTRPSQTDGSFRVNDVPPGKYTIQVTGAPTGVTYVGKTEEPVEPSPPDDVKIIKIPVGPPTNGP